MGKPKILTDLASIISEVTNARKGKSDLKTKIDEIDANYPLNSIYRQALINGNFDVWQRGTSYSQGAGGFIADRWRIAGGSGIPTIVHSRQVVANEELTGSSYYYRMSVNTTSTTVDYCGILQKIENGYRYLGGTGKKVTLSFMAKSSIANKKILPALDINYGTDGSAGETIKGSPITLTSSWKKYTITFNMGSTTGKTFSTSMDDCIQLWLLTGYNASIASVYGDTVAETLGTTGTIDIAQVQLNAGDVALPFMPKSYQQELLDCMRYYQKFSYIATAINTTTAILGQKTFPVPMRAIPTITLSDGEWGQTANGAVYNYTTSTVVPSGFTASTSDNRGMTAILKSGGGLTVGNLYGAGMTLDAEL